MCIAIYQPADKILTEEALKNSWESNPDGGGVAYIKNGEVKIYKELTNFKKFYKNYVKICELKSPMLVHFRIGTHGMKDLKNCHPHRISKDCAFIHNGIITEVDVPLRSPISDTVVFNNDFLKPLYKASPDFLEITPVFKLIDNFIGHSKLIFLRADGYFKIVGEKLGHWDDGVWYSNCSYKRAPVKSYVEYEYDDGVTSVSEFGYMENGVYIKYDQKGAYDKWFAIAKMVWEWPTIGHTNDFGYNENGIWVKYKERGALSKWKVEGFLANRELLEAVYKDSPGLKEKHEAIIFPKHADPNLLKVAGKIEAQEDEICGKCGQAFDVYGPYEVERATDWCDMCWQPIPMPDVALCSVCQTEIDSDTSTYANYCANCMLNMDAV